jgi:hypothetical protein
MSPFLLLLTKYVALWEINIAVALVSVHSVSILRSLYFEFVFVLYNIRLFVLVNI